MQYLSDTVAVVRHFTGKGRIGKSASRILNTIEESDDTFTISVISLMEIMYLAEKNRININLTETLDIIESSAKYLIVDLNSDILRIAETIRLQELHDRLILATAKWLGVKIISSDAAFPTVDGIEAVWN